MAERAQSEPGDEYCRFRDLLIEGFGRSGNNGRVGNLEKRVKYLSDEIKSVKRMQTRMMLFAAGGAGLGGGTAAAIIKLFT